MRAKLWTIAAVSAALAAVCAVTIDEPIARALGDYDAWSGWDRAIAVLEYVAGIEPWKWTSVVALCAGAIACAAVPGWRRVLPAWLFVMGSSLLARCLVNWIKLATGRWRPTEWLARGGVGSTWRHADAWSFPSGHIALFGGLIIPLAIAAPRVGRPLLAVVGFAMIARVAAGGHFVSDVLGGVALCCACTAVFEPVRRQFRS